MRFTIEVLSPLAISERRPGGQFRASTPYVPGAVLRGALAQQLLDSGSPSDPDFEALFTDADAPMFRNAYPAINLDGQLLSSRPLPATAFTCKAQSGFQALHEDRGGKGGHGVYDSLIDQLCCEELNVRVPYLPRCLHAEHRGKWERVEAYTGFFAGKRRVAVPLQLTTRVAVNRRRRVAEEGLLYSPVVISEAMADESQTAFQGSVVVTDANIGVVRARLPELDYVGSGAARGFGNIRVSFHEQSADDLAKRVSSFNDTLRRRWGLWKHEGIPRGHGAGRDPETGSYFSVALQSDAILRSDGWTPTLRLEPHMLGTAGDGATLVRCYAAAEYRGGWNTAWGLPKDTELVARMGSVYVYYSDKRIDDENWITALSHLEEQGVGERRVEGFGEVRVCEEFHQVIQEVGR